jgi:hypothetical protein
MHKPIVVLAGSSSSASILTIFDPQNNSLRFYQESQRWIAPVDQSCDGDSRQKSVRFLQLETICPGVG